MKPSSLTPKPVSLVLFWRLVRTCTLIFRRLMWPQTTELQVTVKRILKFSFVLLCTTERCECPNVAKGIDCGGRIKKVIKDVHMYTSPFTYCTINSFSLTADK